MSNIYNGCHIDIDESSTKNIDVIYLVYILNMCMNTFTHFAGIAINALEVLATKLVT